MLAAIRRDCSQAESLKPGAEPALLRWWQGQANPVELDTAKSQIAELHKRGMWLSCGCIGSHTSHDQRPILAPARNGDTLYLRRLHNRPPHTQTCLFWSEQVVREEPTHDVPRKRVNGPMAVPNFIALDLDDYQLKGQRHLGESRLNDGYQGKRVSKMATRLFWLAESAGWQKAPFLNSPVKALLTFSEKHHMAGTTLADYLYTTVKVWTEQWCNSAFRKCRLAGIPEACWWVQLATGFDTTARTVSYAGEKGQLVTIRVHGQMQVFGGDASAVRFPMVVIALVRPGIHGSTLQSVYAHPVLDERRWMLVDSELERQTYTDLASVANWLKEEMRLEIEISKPLHDWADSQERPDFVLTLTRGLGHHKLFVVETMGFESESYVQRKLELARNLGSEFFFDERTKFSGKPNSELIQAVKRWAGRA